MSANIHLHLEALEKWIDEQTMLLKFQFTLSGDERKQLQAVNRSIKQLTALGVSIPPQLREIKLQLSAREEPSKPKKETLEAIANLESVIGTLKELAHLGTTRLDSIRPKNKRSASKRHYGVSLPPPY